MTIEELMELKVDELKAKADGLGIEYGARANKTELAELIYAKTNNPKGAPEVAQGNETNSDDELVLGNGVFLIPGQMVKVKMRQPDGSLKEEETALDELLGTQIDSISELQLTNQNLTTSNTTLLEANEKLTTKVESLNALLSDKKEGEKSFKPSDTDIDWSDGKTQKIRVRIAPSKNLVNRMRAGISFTSQYSEHVVNEETFKKLVADSFLQVDVLEQTDE